MAALQKIRNRAGLLVGMLGFALLAFVLSDFFMSGSTWMNKFKDKAFVVDGDVVPTKEYFDRVTAFENFQKVMSSRGSLEEAESAQIKEEVYEQMVKEKMLDDQAARLGIAVSQEEIDDMVNGEHVSSVLYQMFYNNQTQQFDRNAMLNFLSALKVDLNTIPEEQRQYVAAMKAQWPIIANLMKYSRLEEKYTALIAGSLNVNNLEAKAHFDATQTSADIAYAMQGYASVADSLVSVSDKEIEALYKKKKDSYKLRSELGKISFFAKDIAPSQEDFKAVEDEMAKVYTKMKETENPQLVVADESDTPFYDVYIGESHLTAAQKAFVASAAIGDTYAPVRDGEAYSLGKLLGRTVASDTIGIELISVPVGANQAANEHIVDSLMTVVKGGKDFSAMVQEVMPQAAGVKKVTEIDLAANHLGEEFIRKTFAASAGEVLKITSQGAIYLVKVHEKSQPVAKVKMALVHKPVIVSDRTLNNLDLELNQFIEGTKDFASFEKNAKEKGYNLMPNIAIYPAQPNIYQIPGTRSIIHWAFNEKEGAVKKFDLADRKIVAFVNSRIEGDYYPMSELKDVLKAEILKEKKAEKIIADLKTKNATNLESYAAAMASRVDTVKFVNFSSQFLTGVGREPLFNVYSELGEVNKQVGPVKGESGVLVFSLLSKTKQDGVYNQEAVKRELQSAYAQRVRYTMEVLKEKMKVEDNRVRFY